MNTLLHPNLLALADTNWQTLKECDYPGRIIFAGVSEDGGELHLATAITGRSKGSQNRRYVPGENFGEIKTEVVDPRLETGDPELTLYPAQAQLADEFAISNGRQTWDALVYKTHPALLGDVLSGYEFEPDKPIFTNRITARCRLGQNPSGTPCPIFEFAVHSPTEFGTTWISSTKPEVLEYGYSLFLATYDGNGDPPIRFAGGPRLIQTACISDFSRLITDLSCSNDFLVAVSLKTVEIRRGIVQGIKIWNRHGDK